MEIEREGEVIGHASRLKRTESVMFTEYRTLGNVSTGVPCFLRYIHKRKENFIVTCAGKTFNTYATQHLKLISNGGCAYEEISCMTGDTYHVYTGVGPSIYAWRRGTERKHTYEGHSSKVILLLAFGKLLVSVDDGGDLKVWNILTEKVVRTAGFKTEIFDPTVLMHPLTFENKIVLGSRQGLVQIWNLNTGSMVHQFNHWKGKKINAIVQTPSRGVVAIGMSKKQIVLFNLEFDVVISTLKCMDEPSTIAFRTDDVPVMMAGSSVGSITAWDLEKKSVISYEKNAHHQVITGLVAFMNEPIFVTSSDDNSVKVWIFDKPDGGFRLLNSRDGHSLPPSKVAFHGEGEMTILSSGRDKCLRSFHIYNETQNRTINNFVCGGDKVPTRGVPVVQFATSTASNNWEDIACFDSPNGKEVYTFWMEKASRGKSLKLPAFSKLEVSAMCVSLCNNFVMVGFKTGELLGGNMQSKTMRKSFGKNNENGHSKEITGVVMDGLSSIVISGSLDNTIKFWDHKTQELRKTIHCEYSIQMVVGNYSSKTLFGAVMSNFEIWVYDFRTYELFGKYLGSSHPILACAFRPDCLWITGASIDGLVRTWDIPGRRLIDCFGLYDTMITSLAYSPSGEFLVTSLSGEKGILLWMNRTVYQHISLMTLPFSFDPTNKETKHKKVARRIVDEEIISDYNFACLEDMMADLIVFADRKNSRWKNLLKLPDIAIRNKPKEPVKKQMIPFMMSLGGTTSLLEGPKPVVNGGLTLPSATKQKRSKKKKAAETVTKLPEVSENGTESVDPPMSKIIKSMPITWTHFVEKLSLDSKEPSHYEKLLEMLESMGPSKVDLEIRSLGPDNGGSIELLLKFLQFIHYEMNSNGHFQSIQAYLGLFLKMYAEILPKNPPLVDALEGLFPKLSSIEIRLTNRVNSICGLTDFVKSDLL